ncbi:SCO family protein [Cohnella sp. GCM10027633]|uniref:SCO family protein n=1 Tax=unclassified Cohnella TaxID=2636738 RepID=UPI00362B1DA4
MDQERNDNQSIEEQVGVAPVMGNRTFLQRYGFPLVLVALCLVLGGYLLISQNKAEELPVLEKGTPFSFTDTAGNNVTLENTNGKVRLLYFFFANCPDVCPPTTAVLSQVQDEMKKEGLFGDKVEFLSVSIDPTHDTTEVLLDYADTYDADLSGWKFLRGDEAATHEIAKKFGVLAMKDPEGNYSHSNTVVLLDKNGDIREWISGMDFIGQGSEELEPKDMVDIVKKIL